MFFVGLFVNIEGYWLSAGEKAPAIDEGFILTESVRQNLKDVARIVSLSSFAVLLQVKPPSINYLEIHVKQTAILKSLISEKLKK